MILEPKLIVVSQVSLIECFDHSAVLLFYLKLKIFSLHLSKGICSEIPTTKEMANPSLNRSFTS